MRIEIRTCNECLSNLVIPVVEKRDEMVVFCEHCGRPFVVTLRLQNILRLFVLDPLGSKERFRKKMAIEQSFRPCSCGNRYRIGAPPRCYFCSSSELYPDEELKFQPPFDSEYNEFDELSDLS
jgi:hypothetical protein